MQFNPLDHPILFLKPERVVATSAWIEHLPFGALMTALLQPACLVELGTHWGHSYCTFCQTVFALALPTKCYAVDTWQGDDHAGHYGAEVLADLRRHHEPRYSAFSKLIQGTFESALTNFPDHSIDLLHIDGRHGYDDAKEDFESYLPRMSDRGIVLMHDTQVRQDDFGVYKLWEELSGRYPNFEFHHGFGLGVLAVGAKVPTSLKFLFEATEVERERLRVFFSCLGAGLSSQNDRRLLEIERNDAQRLLQIERNTVAAQAKRWFNYGAIRSDAYRFLGLSRPSPQGNGQ
jgi:hypothetical protein